MKATFICALGGFVVTGCVALEVPVDETADGPDEASDTDDGCDDCSIPHDLSGELLLFANARLSDVDSAWQSHLPLDEAGTFIGNSLFLYDPNRECEGGGNECRVVELGALRLDDQLGQISVDDGSLRKFVIRDLAWDSELGLWAATFDPLNDEWSISRLEVADPGVTHNSIGVERWVIPPGAAESPSTDPCYWFESVSGLGFAPGDSGPELLIGVRGAGSKGLITDGSLLRVDLDVLDQGHCVQTSDVSQDPLYYACDVLCQSWCSFGDKVGVAGDVVDRLEPGGASAWLRSEDEGVMPLARNELWSCTAPEPGIVADAAPDNVFDDEVVRGDEIEGLARLGGTLYGISVLGKVYRIDEVARTVEEVDDLGNLFPSQGLTVRGATAIVIPAPE